MKQRIFQVFLYFQEVEILQDFLAVELMHRLDRCLNHLLLEQLNILLKSCCMLGKDNFVELGVSSFGASFQIEDYLLVHFVLNSDGVLHKDEVDWDKLFGVDSVESKDLGNQGLVVYSFEEVDEVVQSLEKQILL